MLIFLRADLQAGGSETQSMVDYRTITFALEISMISIDLNILVN